MAKKKTAPVEDTPLVFDLTLNDTTLAGMVKRRAVEAEGQWEKLYKLKTIRENNKKLADGRAAALKYRDERYQDIYSDNIIFKAKRTLLAFVAGRITQPEVTPHDYTSLAYQFAQDFEKVLYQVADGANAKPKIKLAYNDLFDGQRVGILKWVYNPDKKKLELVHCNPSDVIIGSRSGWLEEPDFVQHKQKRTVAKLLQQFPDKKAEIYKLYGIDKGVPSQLEAEKDITENWIFVEDNKTTKLAVIFMAQDVLLGKMSDPNWLEDGENFIDEHMVPFIFFNHTNDGKGWIDNTSFLEQAMYNQQQYDKRGEVISENANYAGIGVPVFGKGAIKEEAAAQVQFNPTQRIMLDVEDAGKGFTTWQAGQLQQFVFEDKTKLETSVYDTFGTNLVQSGADTNTNTLGEAVLMRNQAEGRQQELIDGNDAAMDRLYKIEAQMLYRYADEPLYFNTLGEDGRFEQLVISQKKIADNLKAKIGVKSGTNVPIDRAQRIAVAIQLMNAKRISTKRLYKELGIEDPEQAYKEYLSETLMPFADMNKADKEHDSREAQEDLDLVIGGRPPIQREDIDDDYIGYLTDYLLKQSYEMLPALTQQRVTQFVAGIIAQAQRKSIKQQTQQPVAPNPDTQIPPVRPTSFAGLDRLEPDVKAQVIQSMGYQPSALTPLEMQAGFVTAPSEKINEAPIAGGQPAPTTGAQAP
jgi:hypothetical protein